MRIALYQPDQAGNVGTIMRLAACLGVAVDIIEPCGFPWGDKSLKRAGMDYAEIANVTRHDSWDAFVERAAGRLVLLTTRGGTRSEEHTSELKSLMRISYAVFCLKKKKYTTHIDMQKIQQLQPK